MRKVAQYKSFLRLVFWVLPVVMGLDQIATLNAKEGEAREAQMVAVAMAESFRASMLLESRAQKPVTLDTLLPLPKGFKPKYRVEDTTNGIAVKEPGAAIINTQHLYVTVPDRMPQKRIDDNMRAVAREAFEHGAMCVEVVAYYRREGHHTPVVATLTFAPYGQWDRTDRVYDLEEYKAVIWRR